MNITLTSTVIFMVVAVVPSLLRLVDVGWQPVFLVHIIIISVVIVLFLLRRKIPLNLKAHILFVVYLIIAVAGMINFKLINAAYYIIVLASIATLLYGRRVSYIYSAVFIVLFISVFFLHRFKLIALNVDFNEYQDNTSTWLATGTSYVFVLIVVILSAHAFYKLFIDSIKDLNVKSNELSYSLKALKLSENRYKDIFENSRDGFVFFDHNYFIVNCNQSFSKLIGYELSELEGYNYKTLLYNQSIEWDTILETIINKTSREVLLMHKDGLPIPVEVSPYSTEAFKGGLWVIVRDIRERKKLQREIFKTMIQSEEKERERYAKELHDGLGPLISTTLIYLDTIHDENDVVNIREYSGRAYSILEDATNTIKEISNNLSSMILTEYGVVSAIRSFIEKLQKVSDIKFVIKSNLKGTFEETLKFTFYRILVELINNSIKYSRAKTITITFDYNESDEFLRVKFFDDGEGFDYNQALINKKGFGLLNLQNRIKQIGGSSTYYTEQGKGVEVNLSIKTKYI